MIAVRECAGLTDKGFPCSQWAVDFKDLCAEHALEEENLYLAWKLRHFTKEITPELRTDFLTFWGLYGHLYHLRIYDRARARRLFWRQSIEDGYPKAGLMGVTPPAPTVPRQVSRSFLEEDEYRDPHDLVSELDRAQEHRYLNRPE